jgi:hypothetical protein
MSCARGHSECGLLKATGGKTVLSIKEGFERLVGDTGGVWRVNSNGAVTPEQWATGNRTFLSNGQSTAILIQNAGDDSGVVWALNRTTGIPVWHSKAGLRLVAVGRLGAYAIDENLYLVVLHPTRGVELSRTDLKKVPDERWVPGLVHVADRFVAVERLTGGSPQEPDDRYFLGSTPVVLAGV